MTGVASWPPARYSEPLSINYPSHADWLLPLIDLAWRLPNGKPIQLDDWQRQLIRAMLEVYPKGHPYAGQLRYRQVFVSVARQNGKSVLGAILALYGLIREAGALVIGLASSAEQARIIYDRMLTVVKGHKSLAKRFTKITDTRGIRTSDGSRYEIKASKSAAVQGLDVTVGLIDELHITPPALWSDLVSGTAARRNGIVIGLTTAGDDNSALLKDLYAKADAPPNERFGYFIWEAPQAALPADDEEFGRYLMAASPALAEGRLDLATAISDVRSLPEPDQLRYRMNRFVAAQSVFIRQDLWAGCQGDIPHLDSPVFAFDMTAEKDWMTITAAQVIDGITYASVVAIVPNPSLAVQLEWAQRLLKHNPSRFVVNGYVLGTLGAALVERGYAVSFARSGDELQASAHLYSLVATSSLRHEGNPLVGLQVQGAIRKNVGERFKISKPESKQIDALYSLAFACYYAESESQSAPPQIFI